MRYNVPLYFERKNIKSSDIFTLPDRILTQSLRFPREKALRLQSR